MADLVAKRYAKALYQLCAEENCVDNVYRQAVAVCGAITDEPSFLTLLKHPEISAMEKMALFENAFKGKVSDNLIGLFGAALAKRRGGEIVELLAGFIALVDESRGVTTAYVTSAAPLSHEQITSVKAALSKSLNKLVELKTEVDPDLIGGLCINVDGKVFDSTVKRQMANLKSILLNMQFA